MNKLDIDDIVMNSSESEHEDDVMTGAEVLQTLQEVFLLYNSYSHFLH